MNYLYNHVEKQADTAEWVEGVTYSIDDHVLYKGAEYRCIQAHTSQAGWTPPVVPALWKKYKRKGEVK